MSKYRDVEINCPKCGGVGTFRVWDSINTKLDPEMKRPAISGTMFLFTCPHCGKRTDLKYPFLYHQMEDGLMIHCVWTQKQKEQAIEASRVVEDLQRKFRDVWKRIITRIVSSTGTLREKTTIFEAGLDDRIIEVLKYKYIAQRPVREHISAAWFLPLRDVYQFAFISGGVTVATMPFDKDAYDSVYADLIGHLPGIEMPLIVDQDWAAQYGRLGESPEARIKTVMRDYGGNRGVLPAGGNRGFIKRYSVKNDIRILCDSLKIMDSTVNPDTYFSRYKLAVEKAKSTMDQKGAVYNGLSSSEIYLKLNDPEIRDQLHMAFIDKALDAGRAKRFEEHIEHTKPNMSQRAWAYYESRMRG